MKDKADGDVKTHNLRSRKAVVYDETSEKQPTMPPPESQHADPEATKEVTKKMRKRRKNAAAPAAPAAKKAQVTRAHPAPAAAQQAAPASPQRPPVQQRAQPATPPPAGASPVQMAARSPTAPARAIPLPQRGPSGQAAASPQPVWGAREAAVLRRAEDAKVAAAVRSGRYVDIGVHSFLPTLPPQQLSIPADASVSFLKRQIAQRIQDAGAAWITADAVELQVKDSEGCLQPTVSFSAVGGEMACAAYGLLPDGAQHHVWVLFVDDSAARGQRAASAALTHGQAAPAAASPMPQRPRMTPEAAAAVRAYNAAIAAPPAARAAGQRAPLTPGTGALAIVPDEDDFMHDASPPKQIRGKGQRARWNMAEQEALINGVLNRGRSNWRIIQADYQDVFHPSRTNVDLKDKWRNLCKVARGERSARGAQLRLSQEMIIKILKVLNDDEDVCGNVDTTNAASDEEDEFVSAG